jgi:hypothetical protein
MDAHSQSQRWDARAAALDYRIAFYNGVTETWTDPVNAESAYHVYSEGWTTKSSAENYVARFQVPNGATHVAISAHNDPLHDGNVQIDGIIAAYLPNVKMNSFRPKANDSTYGTAELEYEIKDEAFEQLTIGIYTSPDRVTHGTLLRTITVSDPSKLSVGTHTVEITGLLDGFNDVREDYSIMAVIDPDGELAEYTITDNDGFLSGLLLDPTNRILHMHGKRSTDGVELIYWPAPYNEVEINWNIWGDSFVRFDIAEVAEIHVRLHEGPDRLNASVHELELPIPIWAFGGPEANDPPFLGSGNDTLVGGAADDYLEGGSGSDLIWGGLGRDTILGGEGDDFLAGDLHVESWHEISSLPDGDDDEIFGGEDYDILVGDHSNGDPTWAPGPYVAGNDLLRKLQ